MNNKKYRYLSEVMNDQNNSYVPDVAFHPNGDTFAVSYRDIDEVRVYDTPTQELLRRYRNPKSQLSFPHGIIITENHIIVSNKLQSGPVEPSIFTVYRIDSTSSKPISVFRTPIEHLREAHSLDLHNGKLLVTYSGKHLGAIITYNFDDETGKITGPVSMLEDWFTEYGEPKGISFNENGSKIIITIAVGTPNFKPSIYKRLSSTNGWKKLISKMIFRNKEIKGRAYHHFNGLAVFDVDVNGILSKKPIQIIHKPNTRLENVNIVDGVCVVADPLNDRVLVYQFDGDIFSDHPVQTIQDHLAFPHDACLSPDKKFLVVANYGLEVIDGKPQWGKFRQPRSDKFTVFQLST